MRRAQKNNLAYLVIGGVCFLYLDYKYQIIYTIFVSLFGSNEPNPFSLYIDEISQKTNTILGPQEKVHELYKFLARSESKYYSQNNEDGVILAIVQMLRIKKSGYFVEIGYELNDGVNTKLLKERFNWTGVLLNSLHSNWRINLHQESLHHSEILNIFKKHGVLREPDLLSIDTDYADYWLLNSILTAYNPKVVVHQVNHQPADNCVTVPKPDKFIPWNGLTSFYGASVCAYHCLSQRHKYSMVYCESSGVSCFWIRNDLLADLLQIRDVALVSMTFTPQYLYKKLPFEYQPHQQTWSNVKC